MDMRLDRRGVVAAGLGLSGGLAGLGTAPTQAAASRSLSQGRGTGGLAAPEIHVVLSHEGDQSGVLQAAIDMASERDAVLRVPTGAFHFAQPLVLKRGCRLTSLPGATRFVFTGAGAFVVARNADDILLEGMTFEGGSRPLDAARGIDGLLSLSNCRNLRLRDLTIANSGHHGVSLRACSGSLTGLTIMGAANAGVVSIDARGLDICHNRVTDCGNNGILVWTSQPQQDGTLVAHNRIEKIAARGGGTGQNGNGINIFRAGRVLVTGNMISDCSYSAVRGNAASDIQIISNNCARLGEVALYAEFAFQGAVIASNLVDGAADGIAVTNFNEGGRLATIHGNVIRNLTRRENSQDKRGVGIGVEADAAVCGNTIENAPTAGIAIGWRQWQRAVCATGNVISNAGIGIAFQAGQGSGPVLISNNMITGSARAGIHAMEGFTPVGGDLSAPGADVRAFAHATINGNVAV